MFNFPIRITANIAMDWEKINYLHWIYLFVLSWVCREDGKMEIDRLHNWHITAIWRLYSCQDSIYTVGQNSKFPVQDVIESKNTLGTKFNYVSSLTITCLQQRASYAYHKIQPIDSSRLRSQTLHGLFYFPATTVMHLQCIWLYSGKVLQIIQG